MQASEPVETEIHDFTLEPAETDLTPMDQLKESFTRVVGDSSTLENDECIAAFSNLLPLQSNLEEFQVMNLVELSRKMSETALLVSFCIYSFAIKFF